MADTATLSHLMTAGAAAPGQHRLRVYAYDKTTAIGLVNNEGTERIFHFLAWQGEDDPVDELVAASSFIPHKYSAGLLIPCVAGDMAEESSGKKNKERFVWMVEFPISEAGYDGALGFTEHVAKKWNYQARHRNCVTFAHAMAKKAGIKLSRPLVQRPTAFMARIRGAVRRGRLKPLAAPLPPGHIWGPLPEGLVPQALVPNC